MQNEFTSEQSAQMLKLARENMSQDEFQKMIRVGMQIGLSSVPQDQRADTEKVLSQQLPSEFQDMLGPSLDLTPQSEGEAVATDHLTTVMSELHKEADSLDTGPTGNIAKQIRNIMETIQETSDTFPNSEDLTPKFNDSIHQGDFLQSMMQIMNPKLAEILDKDNVKETEDVEEPASMDFNQILSNLFGGVSEPPTEKTPKQELEQELEQEVGPNANMLANLEAMFGGSDSNDIGSVVTKMLTVVQNLKTKNPADMMDELTKSPEEFNQLFQKTEENQKSTQELFEVMGKVMSNLDKQLKESGTSIPEIMEGIGQTQMK